METTMDKTNTAIIDGKRYVLLPEAQYKRLKAGAKVVVPESDLPQFPKRLPGGNYDAIAWAHIPRPQNHRRQKRIGMVPGPARSRRSSSPRSPEPH